MSSQQMTLIASPTMTLRAALDQLAQAWTERLGHTVRVTQRGAEYRIGRSP